MKKQIFFEKKKQKNSYYLSDDLIDDPDFLSKKNLNKFKEKLTNNYHWNNAKKMNKDYFFLKKFLNKKSKELTCRLNKYHSNNSSEKYWKIIILPWLNYITYLLFDRWELVRSLKNKNKYIFNTYRFKDFELVPTSFKNIHYINKNLNLMIYTMIIDFINCNNIRKKKLSNINFIENNQILILKTLLFKILNLIFFFFNKKILINNLGISFYSNLKLHLYIFKFPFFWIDPNYKKEEIDITKRKKFFQSNNNTNTFENFFDNIIYLLIPKSYLEDFNSINKAIKKSCLPKSCQKIFTAYEYKRNDIFKIWTANMVNNEGAKYYIIQHGGNFGSPQYQTEEDTQIDLADKFYTWGWSKKNNNKIKPFYAFQFSLIKNKNKNKNKNGKFLICLHYHGKYSYRISSLPKTNFERLNKLLQIKDLVDNLKDKSNITIRYPKNLSDYFGAPINEKFFSNHIKFDYCEKKLIKIINQFKIVIHDNDSTTFLMSMFLNIPTILLLDKKVEKFRDNAKKFYYNLERKNIIFYDSLKAAKFINSLDSSGDNWWLNADLQKIRKEFCLNFSKESYKPLNDFKKLLITS